MQDIHDDGCSNDNNEEDNMCLICHEVIPLLERRYTECGHLYDEQCLQKWLIKKGQCPYCRKILRGSCPLHPKPLHIEIIYKSLICLNVVETMFPKGRSDAHQHAMDVLAPLDTFDCIEIKYQIDVEKGNIHTDYLYGDYNTDICIDSKSCSSLRSWIKCCAPYSEVLITRVKKPVDVTEIPYVTLSYTAIYFKNKIWSCIINISRNAFIKDDKFVYTGGQAIDRDIFGKLFRTDE